MPAAAAARRPPETELATPAPLLAVEEAELPVPEGVLDVETRVPLMEVPLVNPPVERGLPGAVTEAEAAVEAVVADATAAKATRTMAENCILTVGWFSIKTSVVVKAGSDLKSGGVEGFEIRELNVLKRMYVVCCLERVYGGLNSYYTIRLFICGNRRLQLLRRATNVSVMI